jgi:hypothetical protein
VIDLGNGSYIGGSPGKEGFICGVQFTALDRSLNHLDAQFIFRQLDDGIAVTPIRMLSLAAE